MRSKSILTFIGILQVITYRLPLSESAGEGCTSGSGRNRTCISLEYCNEAKILLIFGGDPQICGFEGHIPKVCCANPSGSIADRECLKYLNVTAHTRLVAATTTTTNTTEPIVYRRVNDSRFIVGGEPASLMEFPHMALLGYADKNSTGWYCGGSLISENFVLTAAHCLMTKYGNVTKVRLGVHNISSWTSDIQEFGIKAFYRYPNYKSSARYRDIGLIELDHPANITKAVRPACLYTLKKIYQQSFIATGWGYTDPYGNPSDALMKVKLYYVPYKNCTSYYHKSIGLLHGIDEASQLCADGGGAIADTCQGDSGGPLQISVRWGYTIVGITSFGNKCTASPAVYTEVSHYVPWIENTVWPKSTYNST